LFVADKNHIHHRIMARLRDQRMTVAVMWSLAFIIGAPAILLTQHGLIIRLTAWMTVFFGVVCLFYLSSMHKMWLPANIVKKIIHVRPKFIYYRKNINRIENYLEPVSTMSDLYPQIHSFATLIGCSSFSIHLDGLQPSYLKWLNPDENLTRSCRIIHDDITLMHRQKAIGAIRVRWAEGDDEHLFEKRLLAESFFQVLSPVFARIIENNTVTARVPAAGSMLKSTFVRFR
jgi:hypothetical protein